MLHSTVNSSSNGLTTMTVHSPLPLPHGPDLPNVYNSRTLIPRSLPSSAASHMITQPEDFEVSLILTR